MEVTRANFDVLLPNIRKDIENATFLSIDTELTGLNTVFNINAFDTIKQYYKKLKNSSKDFLVIQYGITTFRYEEDRNVFKQSSYNFYIFRRPVNRNIPDQRFLCQSSSIDFLITHGFDFNKLFKEGISYLNITEENAYEENLLERKMKRAKDQETHSSGGNANQNKIAIPDTDKLFIEEIVKLISDFIKTDKIAELQLPKCNPFLRRLIYQTVPEKFGDQVSLETRQLQSKERILFVTRTKTKKEKEDFERKKEEEELKQFDDTLGFTKVLKMIVDSDKLIIGHNIFLDLLHTLDKFLTPLPNDYEEFKEMAHSLFSNILDTKFMCSNEPFKDLIGSSALGTVLETVEKKPFVIPQIEIEAGAKGYLLRDKKEHEAAFDSYITGVSFLAMWKHIGTLANLSDQETFEDFTLLEPYLNRIFLMKLQDNPYVHLGGQDPCVSRDHVFHITFSKDWKLTDIQEFFSPFGNVYVAWIDDSSAYVSLYKREQAKSALKALSKHNSCTIRSYAKYQLELENSLKIKTWCLPEKKSKGEVFEKKNASSSQVPKKRKSDTFEEDEMPIDKSFEDLELERCTKKYKTKTFSEDHAWE